MKVADYEMKDKTYFNCPRPEIAELIYGRPQSILEIGCANGRFRENITWPCEYHGVEPVEDVANEARERGLIVHCGFYDGIKADLPDNFFDLVVCNDVIEHMADPWAFLRDVKVKLRHGGIIVGSVPNVRYILNLAGLLVHKDWNYIGGGVLDRTHLRFFTIKSLARIATECGYSVEVIRPSGPRRFAWIKRMVAPFVWPVGIDTLYMQIAFRLKA